MNDVFFNAIGTNEMLPDEYPTILIPDKMHKSITTDITDDQVYKHLNIEFPKIDLLKLPNKPDLYESASSKTLKIDILGYFILPMMALWVVGFLLVGQIAVGLLFGFIILVFSILSGGVFKTEHERKRIELPQSIYKEKINDYNRKREHVIKTNEELKKSHSQALQNIIESVPKEQFNNAKKQIYFNGFKPYSLFSRNLDNRKRGRTELMFLDKLFKAFGNQIKVDVSPDAYNYFPDFTFVCNTTGLHIDIEIDEPYTIKEKEPIHYLYSNDDLRNSFFLKQNWCVIRFAEEQIASQPDECVELIKNFSEAIRDKTPTFCQNVNMLPKWSYEEALVMAYNNSRDNY